jgi:hypothetical protein
VIICCAVLGYETSRPLRTAGRACMFQVESPVSRVEGTSPAAIAATN